MISLATVSDLLDLYLIFMDVTFVILIGIFVIGIDGLLKRETRIALGMMVYVLGHGMVRTWNFVQPNFFHDRDALTSRSSVVLVVGLALTTTGLSVIWQQMASPAGKTIWWSVVLTSALGAIGVVLLR